MVKYDVAEPWLLTWFFGQLYLYCFTVAAFMAITFKTLKKSDQINSYSFPIACHVVPSLVFSIELLSVVMASIETVFNIKLTTCSLF